MEKLDKVKTKVKKIKVVIDEKIENIVKKTSASKTAPILDNILDLEIYLKRLNPDVSIRLIGSQADQKLEIDCLPEDLVMPDGFEWNRKNGINNKHLASKKSEYISADIALKPLDKTEMNNFDVFYEIRRLNPDVDINMLGGLILYDKKMFEKLNILPIECSLVLPYGVKLEKLILPENFTYNEKDGINNKGKTKSGTYTCMNIMKASTAKSLNAETLRYMKSKKLIVKEEKPKELKSDLDSENKDIIENSKVN